MTRRGLWVLKGRMLTESTRMASADTQEWMPVFLRQRGGMSLRGLSGRLLCGALRGTDHDGAPAPGAVRNMVVDGGEWHCRCSQRSSSRDGPEAWHGRSA